MCFERGIILGHFLRRCSWAANFANSTSLVYTRKGRTSTNYLKHKYDRKHWHQNFEKLRLQRKNIFIFNIKRIFFNCQINVKPLLINSKTKQLKEKEHVWVSTILLGNAWVKRIKLADTSSSRLRSQNLLNGPTFVTEPIYTKCFPTTCSS